MTVAQKSIENPRIDWSRRSVEAWLEQCANWHANLPGPLDGLGYVSPMELLRRRNVQQTGRKRNFCCIDDDAALAILGMYRDLARLDDPGYAGCHDVMWLVYMHGLSLSETARHMRRSVGWVQLRVQRGLGWLGGRMT